MISPRANTHRGRVTRAIELGRRGDRAAIAALVAGGAADRWQAAAAAFGDRDGARVLGLLGDASRRVRGLATVVAPLACDDDQAVRALHAAWACRRERRLLRRMAVAGRVVAIDRFLDDLAAAGHVRELIDALPFGSTAAVRRHLTVALERPSARLWAGLADHHPALLAEILGARWAAHPGEADPLTRQLTAAHHVTIADRDPDRGLALAELLLTRAIEPGLAVWRPLLRRRPDAAVALAIRFVARLPVGLFAARARELAPTLLATIMEHAAPLLGDDGAWIRQTSPDRQQALAQAWLRAHARWPRWGAWLLAHLPADAAREAAYQAWTTAARGADGAIAATLLARLPIDLAAREARRHLVDVVALATDAAARLTGRARYLPWTELTAAITPHLGHPDGAVRALALRELLAVPGVYPDDRELPALALALVVARTFEQDPVRQAMFETLARWPRRVWRAEHLPAVAQAVRAMLDAADCSGATAAAAERVVVRLIAVDATWAGAWLGTLVKERGMLHDPRLGAKLGDADLIAAAPALLAIARTWHQQERLGWLALLADSLGRRLPVVAGLSALVAKARDGAVHEWDGLALTRVLADHAPALHLPTLGGVIDRFRKRGWWGSILALASEHGRRPGQQVRRRARRRPELPDALAAGLVHALRDAPAPIAGPAADALHRRAPAALDAALPALLAADESLIRLPAIRHWLHRHRQDLLAPFLAGKRVTGKVATGASVWVLGFDRGTFRWTPADANAYAGVLERVIGDRERDTPTVLTALATRAAIDWADQAGLCGHATDERAAVQEKAIRVLARCDAGQGVPTLLACLDDARARFAIYGLRRALFELAPVRAVELLADAPMRKVTVAKEVVRLLGELRTPAAVARLDALAAGALHRDVRIALLRALWDHLDRPETWAIFERAAVDPDWITASRLADIPADRLTVDTDRRLAALLATIIGRPEPEARIDLLRRAGWVAVVDRERAFLAACRARLASPFDDEVTAAMGAVMARSTEADVAALAAELAGLRRDPRALHVAGAALARHDVRSRASWQACARALAEVAADDPRWSALAVTATGALVDPAALTAMLARLAGAGALDHDALVAAGPAVATIRDEDRAALRAALAASPHAAVRRVAVMALAADAGPGRGWTPERLAALAALRADPSPTVAGAAARAWPPREDDPGFA